MQIMGKDVAQTWTFASQSDPKKTYESVLYMDGSTSCGCRGWTNAKGGIRTCRHTRSIDEGTADAGCIGTTNYRTGARQSKPSVKVTAPVTQIEEVEVTKGRKIKW